jgi:hypothetical protein
VTGHYGEVDFRADSDITRSISDLGAVERVNGAVLRLHLPQPNIVVETVDFAAVQRASWANRMGPAQRLGQGTILLIGSSIMSVAPASLSSGINLFIISLGTTVSTA